MLKKDRKSAGTHL